MEKEESNVGGESRERGRGEKEAADYTGFTAPADLEKHSSPDLA